MGSEPVGARKKCLPAIWKWEKLIPSYFEPDKHCCSYLEIEKCGSLLLGDLKKFTTVRSKEKDYDIYLKSEKLVHSQQEHEKNVSQLFGSGKNEFLMFPSYPFRSKEKDYDIYLKSEKLVHSQQDTKKMFPSYLEVEKTSS